MPKAITIAQVNQRNEKFWKRQNRRTSKLIARPYVLGPALLREKEKAGYLSSATDQEERLRRLREQKSFESELQAIDAEVAPRRLFLAQQARAKGPRGKVTSDGKTLNQMIRSVALSHAEKPPKRLWSVFIAELELLGLDPTVSTSLKIRRETCHYNFGAGQKSVTERHFANVVSDARNGVKDKPRISG